MVALVSDSFHPMIVQLVTLVTAEVYIHLTNYDFDAIAHSL